MRRWTSPRKERCPLCRALAAAAVQGAGGRSLHSGHSSDNIQSGNVPLDVGTVPAVGYLQLLHFGSSLWL